MRQILPRPAVVADLARASGRSRRGSAAPPRRGREAGPRADVDLAERRILDNLEAEPLADRRAPSRSPGGGRSSRRRRCRRRRGCSASSAAWRRPCSLSGGSAWPCHRPMRFQSVSPWRASRIRVAARTRLAARGSGARRKGRSRHRLEPGDRPRDRDAARRGGSGRRLLRARRGRARRRGAAVAGPGPAHGVVADVTDAGRAPRQSSSSAVQAFGGLDIVVNNVGGSGARTIDEMDADDLDAVLDRNLFPALARLPRRAPVAARARRRRDRADRVDLGSRGGRSPSYNVAKAAEISLAKAMARDLAKDGIRVFSVAPGSTLFPGGSWERRSGRIPTGSRRSSSASCRGAASARSTRSPTSSRSSSRPAHRGSSAPASRSTAASRARSEPTAD